MNYKHIMNLAIKRRDALIKRLDAERAKEWHDHASQVKCDQIMMQLQGENQIIGDCRQILGATYEAAE